MTLETTGLLAGLSADLAGIVEKVGASGRAGGRWYAPDRNRIIWSADGMIVTTSHGVERDEDVTIELHDGTRLAAVLIGRDPDTDIAALRVEAAGLPAIEIAADDAAKAGQIVLALGRPGNSGLHATMGIISARLESQSEGGPETVLHTDAGFYPGFSGGPLVNTAGQMVGLNNLMFGRGRGVSLGAAIVRHVVDRAAGARQNAARVSWRSDAGGGPARAPRGIAEHDARQGPSHRAGRAEKPGGTGRPSARRYPPRRRRAGDKRRGQPANATPSASRRAGNRPEPSARRRPPHAERYAGTEN